MEQTANTMPAATLGQYKGLAFTRRVRPVSDKAVEADIGNLARVHAPFVPTDAPAARGMRVTLDFEGFLEGAPIPDSRMEKVTVVLGTGQLMPAAEEAVYGHCAGETFRFDFTYPADFRVRSFPARPRSLRSACTQWSASRCPRWTMPLQNRWALQTLRPAGEPAGEKAPFPRSQRRPHCRGGAAGYGRREPDRGAARRAAGAERRIPDEPAAPAAAQEPDDHGALLQERRADPGAGAGGYRREAERQLRAMLAVRAIAEAEKITVTQQEVDAEIARLSKLHDTPEEEIRKVLSRDAIADRRDQPEGAAFPARPRRPYLCCGKGVRPWAFYQN